MGPQPHEEIPMAVITMRQMLEAGAHFGHQTRRWNPKMKRFIFGERNGIYIIDLEQTLGRVETAYEYVRDLVARGGTILFVGTKKQAQDPVRSYAEKCGMPYVNERWLGGMLTNFETISKRVAKMLEYERMQASGEFDVMIKKEALLLDRELTKLQRNLGGLRSLDRTPDAIFVLDTKKEHIAVTEANKLGIPVVAVVDTNVDPEVIQYPIPGNDDAIRSNSLFARVIADAVEEGRFIANQRNPAPPAAEPRSAEEEAAFEAEQAAARAAAAQAQADRDARLAAAKDQPAPSDAVAEAEEVVKAAAEIEAEALAHAAEVVAEAEKIEAEALAEAAEVVEAATALERDAVAEAQAVVEAAEEVEAEAVAEAEAVVEAAEEVEAEALAEAEAVVEVAEEVEAEAVAEAVEVVEAAEEVEAEALAEAEAVVEVAEEVEAEALTVAVEVVEVAEEV
jgi:small subunit ribosomal protein S2